MQILEIEFTARRYHATPWDAHVNEGRIEWPPSPWRLVRALLAVGYSKFGWTEGPSDLAASLIKKISACDPDFSLPKATETHTRHYMPIRKGKSEGTAKVFDAFLRLSNQDERLLIRYNIELSDKEREELTKLTSGLSYLGRAESWVEAGLLKNDDAKSACEGNTWHGLASNQSSRRIRLLAPLDSESYDQWRSENASEATNKAEADERIAAEAKEKKLTPNALKKKIEKARTKAEQPYPIDLLAAYQQDTSKWQAEGWPRPPGSRWVDYEIPNDLLERTPLIALAASPPFIKPEAILLSIDGEGKQGTVRPPMRRVLPLMELLHSEAVRHAGRLGLGHLPELTGTDAAKNPLRDCHTHAHWLPLSFNGNGLIDHVLVYAPGRFSQSSVEAISAIRWAYSKGIRALSVNMVGQGTIAKMSQQLRHSNIKPSSLTVFESSAIFESVTPLVLRKYLHQRGKKTVEGQIREELQERGYPEPTAIKIWPQKRLIQQKLKGYVLRRQPKKQQPRFERSWGLTIHFSEPIVKGPISLGYASHYGLGLFQAVQPGGTYSP